LEITLPFVHWVVYIGGVNAKGCYLLLYSIARRTLSRTPTQHVKAISAF